MQVEMTGCDVEKESILRQLPARAPSAVYVAIGRATFFDEVSDGDGIVFAWSGVRQQKLLGDPVAGLKVDVEGP